MNKNHLVMLATSSLLALATNTNSCHAQVTNSGAIENPTSVEALDAVLDGTLKDTTVSIATFEKIAKIDPCAYARLGTYCVLNNLDEQAAKYFRLAFDTCKDKTAIAGRAE